MEPPGLEEVQIVLAEEECQNERRPRREDYNRSRRGSDCRDRSRSRSGTRERIVEVEPSGQGEVQIVVEASDASGSRSRSRHNREQRDYHDRTRHDTDYYERSRRRRRDDSIDRRERERARNYEERKKYEEMRRSIREERKMLERELKSKREQSRWMQKSDDFLKKLGIPTEGEQSSSSWLHRSDGGSGGQEYSQAHSYSGSRYSEERGRSSEGRQRDRHRYSDEGSSYPRDERGYSAGRGYSSERSRSQLSDQRYPDHQVIDCFATSPSPSPPSRPRRRSPSPEIEEITFGRRLDERAPTAAGFVQQPASALPSPSLQSASRRISGGSGGGRVTSFFDDLPQEHVPRPSIVRSRSPSDGGSRLSSENPIFGQLIEQGRVQANPSPAIQTQGGGDIDLRGSRGGGGSHTQASETLRPGTCELIFPNVIIFSYVHIK